MAFPVVPAIQGGVALTGALMSLLGKKQPAQTTQLQQLTPEQQQAQAEALQQAQQGLQDPGAGFDPIAQQARSQFFSQTAPGIAERFAGLGATRSSAFPAALAGAGQQLEGNLAAQRAQFGLQNRNSLMNLLRLGLAPQFENIFQPEAQGTAQALGGSFLGQGLGGLTSFLGQRALGKQQGANTIRAIEAFQRAQQGGR